MKFILLFIYTLKINLLQIFVNNCRNHSISINYIDSSVFEATRSTSCPDEFADHSFFVNNITDIPII